MEFKSIGSSSSREPLAGQRNSSSSSLIFPNSARQSEEWQVGPRSTSCTARPDSLGRRIHEAYVFQTPECARTNIIHTAKYTPLTWLPKSLYMQFHRAANIYFVIVALLSSTPLWIGQAYTKVSTVASVLFAQALKDLYEDLKRRRDDREGNRRTFVLYDPKCQRFVNSLWWACRVGDLILVKKGEQFPADSLLLASAAGSTGVCHVSTKSLDGETNLKRRQAVAMLSSLASSTTSAEGICAKMLAAGIEIRLEQPHPSLLSMDCSVGLSTGQRAGACLENFALRGCELHNTDWVICIVCYIGSSTKVRLNASGAVLKRSELERYLNVCVSFIIICIFTVSSLFAVLEYMFGYHRFSSPRVFTVYIITLYAVLPMTLYIIFELLHIFIGWQIESDPLMYDAGNASYAKARNTSVLEDCGQASFIFSDKTGTLTANEMRFANCCIGNSVLGSCLPDLASGKQGPGFAEAQRLVQGAEHKQVREFFETLAVCNTVRVDEDGNYQGESPDEVALVEAASKVDVKLIARSAEARGEATVVRGPWGSRQYLVAHVLAFTSDRKRMSVVCPTDDGGALVLTKGADVAMERLLVAPVPEGARAALQRFASAGLRTLIVARRRMNAREYAAWRTSWDQASAAITDRAVQIERVSAAAETGMNYVGITALEDRLQDDVPETITALRRAGIRVWVLTGDKVETAVEIARACKLFEDKMEIRQVVEARSSEEALHVLRDPQVPESGMPSRGLVLDGMSFQHIAVDALARRALYDVAAKSSACVCCRLSPLQKRELVELVRSASDSAITLAIGDGANDVPMIQGAHVGVGIRGKEGAASVQACDVAICQFKFLRNLLFCHGRKAYRRIATVVCYFMYKSLVLGWSFLIYAHMSRFSGDFAFSEWLDVTFNPLSTFAVFVVLAFDCDVPDQVALQKVELYGKGLARAHLNRRVFAKWMWFATLHGISSWCLPTWILTGPEDWIQQGPNIHTQQFWNASFTIFTVIMLVIHGKLFIMAEKPMKIIGMMAIVLELAAYFGVAFFLGSPLVRIPELQDVPWTVLTSWRHVLCIILVPSAALSLDFADSLKQRQNQRYSEHTHLM